jgi:nucleoside-diphosphate-sugar epimerase
MKKILVTGSAGNLGKILMQKLKSFGYDAKGFDKERGENTIYGNILNLSSLVNATKGIDTVIHAAALIKGNKENIERINIKGTENVVRACRKSKVKHILFISSYDINFNSDYGISKLKAEKIVENSGINFLIFRPTILYGKNFTTGINELTKLIKKFPIIPVAGNGKNKFQPLFAEDFAELICQAISKDRLANKSYFIGGAEEISMNELIDVIADKIGKKIIKVHIPDFVSKISKSIKNLTETKICDNSLVKKDFKFNPLGIRDGVKKILDD